MAQNAHLRSQPDAIFSGADGPEEARRRNARGPDAGARQLLRLGLGTGVMGGYTTYSTFALETVRLVEAGAVFSGLGYALGTVLLGLSAAMAGGRLAARLSP